MKKLLCLLFVALLTVVPLVSCADKPGEDTDTNPNDSAPVSGSDVDTEPKEEILEIPDEKFDGEDFTILVNKNYNWSFAEADFDEPSDEPLSNAIYMRNRAVEEMLGCTISQYLSNDNTSVNTDFQTGIDAGDDSFDVAFLSLLGCGTHVGAGRCYDLAEFEYLNLEKSWWDQASVTQLALGGKNYMVGGEALYSDKECIWLMFFTKKIISDLGLEDPYKLVENNNWTWDKMNEMAQAAAMDEDGDGAVTYASSVDVWGLCTHDYHYPAMWVSAGQRLVTLDEDGIPYATWGTESFFETFAKISEILGQTEVVKDNDDKFIIKTMAEGRTLFAGEVIGWVSGYRNNEYDFGLLPMPKYSADQDSYSSFVCQMADLLVIGNNCKDTYKTGIILEALAAKGKEIMLPEYYNVQLQSRYARDEESSAMLDIIFNNRVYDIGTMFNWGGVSASLMTYNANPSTLYASLHKAFNKTMSKSLEKLGLMN